MGYLFALVTIALYLFYVFMLLRMLFDWVRMFAPGWRPKGIALLCASAVYAVTDWPMEKLRRVIPPVRVGNVALDTGFLILIVVVSMLLGPILLTTGAWMHPAECYSTFCGAHTFNGIHALNGPRTCVNVPGERGPGPLRHAHILLSVRQKPRSRGPMIVKWVPTTVCAMRHTAPDAGAEHSRRVAPSAHSTSNPTRTRGEATWPSPPKT